MDKNTKRYIEKLLADYPRLLGYIADAKKEPVSIQTVTRLQVLESHQKGIKHIIDGLEPYELELVQMKYWTRPQRFTWTGIALQLGYTERQCYNIRDSIIEAIGKELGLVR